MQCISQMIVKEKIRIDECSRDDEVRIEYSPNSSWKKIGTIVLLKVKPIGGGKVQIKYLPRFVPNATVKKADLDASLVVERSRPATRADVLKNGSSVTVVAESDIEILPPL